MTRSDVTLCSWKSPAPSAGNTELYLSRSVSTKQSGWLQNLWTTAGTLYKTCSRHQPLWPANQCLTDTWASISKNAIDKAVGQWRKRLCASMKAKGHHFEHLLNWNRHFSEPTHYTTGSCQSHQQSTEENSSFQTHQPTHCFASFPLQLFKSKQSK